MIYNTNKRTNADTMLMFEQADLALALQFRERAYLWASQDAELEGMVEATAPSRCAP